MADDVTLPGTGKIVATEELSGNRHAQVVQISPASAVLLAILAPGNAGGYAVGEQISNMILIQDVPEGVYRVSAAGLIDVSGTNLAVPEFTVYGYAIDAGATPPTYPVDTDPIDPDLGVGGLGTLLLVPAGFLTFSNLPTQDGFLYAAPTVPPPPLTIKGTTDPTPALADVYLAVVSNELTALDFTGGLVLSLTLERLGSNKDVLSFLGS